MELITGFTLREVLKHCGPTTGPMPVPVALNILNQICDALDYAHNLADDAGQQLGIIHRDVSPSNIIVAEGGCVKLIDFGIAKASAVGMQTMSGTIKGKFGYRRRYIGGSIDARADLFAVGVTIAHEAAHESSAILGSDDMDTLNRVMKMEIHPPSRSNPHVPVEIDEIVMTALERDPERRWQHASPAHRADDADRGGSGSWSRRHVIEWITWALEQRTAASRACQPASRRRMAAPACRT
jgi:serine/threonine protein kinase